MSDAPPPASTNSSSSSAPAPASKPERKPRRWRRRIFIAVVALLAVVVVMRIILVVALPSVLRKVAARYDLNCEYEHTEMYLISGNVGVWHLTLTPKSGGAPLLAADYLRGDVSALNLLRGRLVAYHLEGDGINVSVERNEKGEIPVLQQFLSRHATPAPAKTVASSTPSDIDLDPPLRIDSFRGSRVRAHLIDRSVSPAVDTTLDVNVRLADFGSLKRPMQFDLVATAPPLLDVAQIEGTGTARGKAIDAKMHVNVRGIHPKPVAGYLAALGLRPSADSLSLQMNATVKTEATEPPTPAATTRPSGLKGSIVLTDLAAVADGAEAAGLDKLTIGIDQFTYDRIKLGTVAIENVRANARRTADGKLRVAGIDLIGAPPSAPTPPQTAPTPIPPWSLKELIVRNVKASFHDDAVTPAANLAVVIDQAGLKNLASDGSDLPTDVALQMSMPGIAQNIHASGMARPIGATKTLDLKIVAEGVKPDALKPYLDALGVESQLKNGVMTCDLRASLTQGAGGKLAADAKIGNVKFTDGQELFAFEGVTLAGAKIDPAANLIRIETIDIVGPSLTAARDKAGMVGALGLVQKPVTAVKPAPAPAAAASRDPFQPIPIAKNSAVYTANPTVQPTVPALPKIEIGQLTWRGTKFRFDDQAVSPPTSIRLGDSGVEVNDLHIDLDPKAAAGTPGKFRAWMTAPGMVGKLALNGTIAPTPKALALELDVTGQNLRAGPLTPYLQALGIKPELRDGSFQSHAKIALSRQNDQLSADVALSGVKYADGGQELAGLDGLRITDATLAPDGVAVNEIIIDKPRARVMRAEDGTFVAGGARLIATTQPVVASPTATLVATGASEPSSRPAEAGPPVAKMPVIVLNKLRINDADLTWIDHAVARHVDASARANVQLDGFVFGKKAEPAKLRVTLAVPQTVQNVTVMGEVSAASIDSSMAKLEIAATGIQQGWLASYLPPEVRMNLADGRFRVKLAADAALAPQGGRQVHLVVSDLDYRDGAQGQPLLRFDSAKILASRIDPVGGKVITVDEISLAGFETTARKARDGTIRALGLTLGGTPPPQTSFAGATPAAQTASAKVPPAPAAAAPTTNVAELIAQERTPLPLVTLGKLDVQLRKVSYVDDSRPEAAPIALADVKVRNRKPIEVLGSDAQSRPPIEIETTGRIDPLVQTFTVAMVTAPFASQPTLVVDVTAAGIKGDGVAAVVPELKSKIDGGGLTDGRFTTHLEAAAKFSRRGPAQYDFGKPFDAEFTVRPLEYRGTPDGPVLAGLEEIRGDGIHVDPASGGVIVRTLEITKPIGNVWRDQDGVHVLGLVLKETPAAATQPAEQQQQPSLAQQTPSAKPQAAPPAAATTKPGAEIRIDRLLVSGIDFKAEDRTTTPSLLVPLNNLDVEVRNLSSLALYEDKPIRFSVLAGAGKVPLANKGERDLFSEVTANGNLSLYPRPRGYTKASVSGFEMLGIAGAANANKVNVGGGVFDGTFDVRFQDGGVIDTRSRLALTDLKLSEAPNGPIQSALKLNMPIDAAILVLQDASGAITVPLHVPIKQGEVSAGAVVGSAAGAFAQILATAVASSPLKVAGGVTSMIGLGGKEKETGSQPAGEVDFAPADTQLSAEAQTQVNALIEKMRRQGKLELTLKHELGGADLVRAAVLANPSPADCTAIAEQIRARKGRLLQSRQQLASTARAQLASGDAGSAQMTIEELRGIDRDLAAAEDALDRVYELLRPGADRQADRRTRAAALYIAQQRLDAVHAALLDAGVPELDQRIRVTRAQFAEPEKADSEGKITFTVLEKKKP